ncbi:outer membrane protein [Sphingobium wenxiniae]|uniref:Membrane protein n=2 Tax=Sphingobium TaxID=165695 RepID=T0G5P8_9SPHN|nr:MULTISPECIES: TolC family outer membrane protein [Sphingobium]EQA99025.1 membrane protein [Sphingobium baderi LL03]KMS61516.1 membrane protein [Sphingobium baderi LL03]MBB6191797.1 outer membrane protein [Sphingobium wenxiniae]TWH96830.1 outer membrane protein [Sphingobium wenxiniae]WRD75169.1 TolC family outer membrane protein [Sphingobium baderi]
MTAKLSSIRLCAATALLLVSSAMTGPAWAETLQGALVKAYRSNPTLTGARAGQRATDENVPIQKAAGRPALDATGSYSESILKPTISFTSPQRTIDANAQLSVPIYSGGAVRNGVKAAKVRVEAGQANLRGTEASIFSQVVAAYMDVIRDSAIVSLNRANVNVLEVNLQATNDRFEVGDVTRTDVAQSESRLALARSDLQTAEANLISSRENYVALVGDVPDNLEPPPALPGLPDSPMGAVQVALSDNPDILAAKKASEAARYDVKVARAGTSPRLSAFTQAGYTNYLDSLENSTGTQINKQAVAGVQINLPLYQGGRPAAQVRQNQALESQAMEQQIEIERGVIAQTRASYASWQASLQTIASSQKAVEAASLSLEGVRAENSVGSRTILDILNAEQESLNARVELVSARRNAYVAGFTLLAAMGHAEARDLGLEGGALYDPMVNYDRVKGKWFDWDYDRAPVPQATRTVDTPAQNANVQEGAEQP